MIQHLFTSIQKPSLQISKHKAGSQLCAENAIEIQIKKRKKRREKKEEKKERKKKLKKKEKKKKKKKVNDNKHVSGVTLQPRKVSHQQA